MKVETIKCLSVPAKTSYIATATKNTAINLLKKTEYYKQTETLYDEIDDVYLEGNQDSLDMILIREEQLQEVLLAFQMLPEKEKDLLKNKYFLQLTDREIAKQIGCKAQSVRMKLTRARNTLRKILKERGYELDE